MKKWSELTEREINHNKKETLREMPVFFQRRRHKHDWFQVLRISFDHRSPKGLQSDGM